MRTRTRLLLSFVGVHLALSLLLAIAAWRWVDRSMRTQAEASARAIGAVLRDAPFRLDQPWVHQWVRDLSGHEFTVLPDPAAVAPPGAVAISAGTGSILIAYRTASYRRMQREVLGGTLAMLALGSLAFAAVTLVIARRLARPLEGLARSARTIGAGELDVPVAAAGDAEIQSLGAELEQMRARLLALDQERRQAERLRTLGAFTATIAHEVRNPLSAVRLTVQLLARRQPQDAALALVLAEIERLDLIVDELLGFSKGMQAVRVPTDLRQVAQDVLRLLARQAEHAGVRMAVEGEAWVDADPQRLRQLVMNLVLNAIQAQHGGGSLTVAILPDGLEVRDTGPGVPAAQVPHLFTAFATTRADGTGLGLHLAKAVAEAHGAELTYTALTPRGSCFRLRGLGPATPPGVPPDSRPAVRAS